MAASVHEIGHVWRLCKIKSGRWRMRMRHEAIHEMLDRDCG